MTTAALRPTLLRPAPLVAGLAVLLGAALGGILIGPVSLDGSAVLRELTEWIPFVDHESGLSGREEAILWQLRLPRVALAGAVGAMLSLAGAAYQGVFRNPLADPYLLGVAAGAGLGATVAIVYGPDTSSWGFDLVPVAAFIGALGAVMAAYTLGKSGGARRTMSALVLSGVAVASFLTAIQTFVQQREAEELRQVYAWILGRLTTAGWDEVLLILPYVSISAVVIVMYRRLLDVMSVGDEETDSLGVRAARVRLVVVVAASLGTAAAVAVSGLIAFVGIIVPHTVRLIVGPSYRLVIPLSVLFGAAFLIVADMVGRTVLAPQELPIGVVTAVIGAPFFGFVLRASRKV